MTNAPPTRKLTDREREDLRERTNDEAAREATSAAYASGTTAIAPLEPPFAMGSASKPLPSSGQVEVRLLRPWVDSKPGEIISFNLNVPRLRFICGQLIDEGRAELVEPR